MVVNIISPNSVALANQVLDKGLQRVLALCKEMQDDLDHKFAGKLELLDLLRPRLAAEIEPWTCRLYTEMTQTMFQVLRIMQPEDFEGKGDVNFYFWPGYHSYLTNKRMFCRSDERPFLGVGACGNTNGATVIYDDCRQARWYRFAVTPVDQLFPPASPYRWIERQHPTVTKNPHDLIASLTFSNNPPLEHRQDFPEHRFVTLGHLGLDSIAWGEEVAAMLNDLPHLSNQHKKFPYRHDLEDTKDFNAKRDHDLRTLRLYLISLWLHSAFVDSPPAWWQKLLDELDRQALPDLLTKILDASEDVVAGDWSGQNSGHPLFTTLTTICFHPLVAPSPSPIIGPLALAQTGRASVADDRNIGWATLMCSVPLRLPFISLMRDWIDRVYGTIRNTEVSLVLKHREPLERAAQMVRTLAHDTDRFMKDRFGTMFDELADCSKDAILLRQFIMRHLSRLISFMYGLTSAAPDPDKVIEFRRKFVQSLSGDPNEVRDILYEVAIEERDNHVGVGKASVKIPRPKHPVGNKKSSSTYTHCFLLVGELVRNYCEHAAPKSEATLTATVDQTSLVITLEGKTKDVPAGRSFALLHNFLEGLGLGDTSFYRNELLCVWTVRVDLGERRSV